MQRHQPSESVDDLPRRAGEFVAPADISVLVVEPVLDELLEVVSAISNAGLHVTATATFSEAKSLISARTPSILIAAIRLGLYNGLHLVLRGKAMRPEMAALVTAPEHDPVLQADAEAVGATFMVKPVSQQDLIAAALQTLFRSDPNAGPIRPPFERRVRDRREAMEVFVPERRMSGRRRILGNGSASA